MGLEGQINPLKMVFPQYKGAPTFKERDFFVMLSKFTNYADFRQKSPQKPREPRESLFNNNKQI